MRKYLFLKSLICFNLFISMQAIAQDASLVNINTSSVSAITTTTASCGGSLLYVPVSTDLWTGASVTNTPIYTDESSNDGLAGLHDGNLTAGIGTNNSENPDYIKIDFGSSKTFNNIKMASIWGAGFINGCALYSSTNDVDYSNLGTISGNVYGELNYINISFTGRYLKLTAENWIGLAEIQFFENPTGITEKGVVWNTSGSPTVGSYTGKTSDGATSASYASSLTGLTPNTTYYVRAYVTNNIGTGYGSEYSFTTLGDDALVFITTNSVSDVNITTATCGGNVGLTLDNPWSGATQTNNGVYNDVCSQEGINGLHDGILSSGIGTTNVAPGPFVTIDFGSSKTFENIKMAPLDNTCGWGPSYLDNATVSSSLNGTDFTSLGTISGMVNNQMNYLNISFTGRYLKLNHNSFVGVSEIEFYKNPEGITERGVVWNTSGSPTIGSYTGKTSNGTSQGSYSSSLTGLSPNTTYYVRAYVTNNIGTNYGAEYSFTTSNTCIWNGNTSSEWSTASNWLDNAIPTSTNNVSIPNVATNDPIINQAVGSPAVCNNLTIDVDAVLSINEDKALTVNGNITNNGVLTLNSDVTGTATLLNSGTISGSGAFYVEQYLTGTQSGGIPNGRMYYISPSTASSTSNVFDALGPNKLWSYNEATNSYSEIINNVTTLNSMQGYVVRVAGNGMYTFTGGALNTGNISNTSLTRTGVANDKRGFHLLGNPYPSYLSWEDATKTNLGPTFWYRTHSGVAMVYDNYNADNNTGTNNNTGGAVNEFIAPNQAFWVRVNADGATGQLAFTNAMRYHKDQNLMKSNDLKPNTFRFSLHETANQSKDETIIIFDNQAAEDFDSWDSEKMFTTNIAQCYTSNNGGEMVMNSMLPFAQTKSVPVGIQITASGEHQFKADLTDFDPSMTATLEDKLNNSFTEMFSSTVYTFIADAETNNDRFVLHFGFMATDIKNQANANSSIYAYKKSVYINSLSEGTIEVTDPAGRVILNQSINSGMNKIELNTPGVYMVRLMNGNEVRVCKIVIN